MITPHKREFRRKVSVKAVKDKINQLQLEIDYFKHKTEEEFNPIENILDDSTDVKTLISPCYGDPLNRDVFSGGFIPKNHFYTPGKTITADNGQIYIKAGPRYHVALDNEKVKACIVTCGGLCPGLNVVIRELVMSLRYNYGVQDIFGIKWGYAGFYDDECWVRLTPDDVKEIHTQGGTVLGTSRGGFDGPKIAAEMLKRKINMGFFIGGDGTHRGIKELSKIFRQKKEKIILVGIPKTIDNDIPIIDRSFGLDTAVAESVRVIRAADVEANCNPNGIGLVKLFGRHSGYVAMYAALAARDVNICLIPEVPFNLYGENGLLDYIFKRIEIKHHAVIVVGEGAGYAVKDYDVQYSGKTDASGNPVLPDIGVLLKKEINKRGQELGIEINLKYIDPTYIIRAGPANSYDCNLCSQLAQNAVHCAFAGYTNFSIGIINNHSAMIPIDKISRPGVTRKIELGDDDYLMMLASTGQPSFFASEDCTNNVSASVNKPKDESKDKQSETTKQQPIEIPKTLPIEDTKHDTTEQTLPSHSENEGEHKDELRFDEE